MIINIYAFERVLLQIKNKPIIIKLYEKKGEVNKKLLKIRKIKQFLKVRTYKLIILKEKIYLFKCLF